jgi:flagellar protein FliO/FliZ
MLLLTLAVVFALAYALKHFKKIVPPFQGNIQVLGGTSLGNKSKVVLLEAYQTRLLIGVTDNQIQTLYVFTNEQNKVMDTK